MGWCILLLVICAVFGVAGWATALIWLGRARRYREAFERAFALARRVYTFSVLEQRDRKLVDQCQKGNPLVLTQ